jgi:hypothetical protein
LSSTTLVSTCRSGARPHRRDRQPRLDSRPRPAALLLELPAGQLPASGTPEGDATIVTVTLLPGARNREDTVRQRFTHVPVDNRYYPLKLSMGHRSAVDRACGRSPGQQPRRVRSELHRRRLVGTLLGSRILQPEWASDSARRHQSGLAPATPGHGRQRACPPLWDGTAAEG